MEFGPANLRLLNDAQLSRHFRHIAIVMPNPTTLAIGMAGARTESDRERIRRAAAQAWPGVPCYATNDLETALMAAEEVESKVEGRKSKARVGHHASRITHHSPRVLVLSGTGSCCFGRTWDGRTAKVGGWGHILGDKGSGFEIGLRALKAVVYYLDRDGEWSLLGRSILRKLQLNEPDELIGWAQNAGKTEIAALAVEVFQAWAKRDKIASDVLAGAADSLARDAASCARKLAAPGSDVQFVFAGSVLLRQPRFAQLVGRKVKMLWPRAIITALKRESVWGAVELARQQFKVQSSRFKVQGSRLAGPLTPSLSECESAPRGRSKVGQASRLPPSRDRAGGTPALLSPTEQRNPRSMNLDKLPLADAIGLMLREDAKIPGAILKERMRIERAVRLIVRAFRREGRLIYVGAGTSGRLGVLDASECPPTFRTPPEMVQGIIAGGQTALWEAVEGAEDDPQAGARAVAFCGVGRRDVVVGIAASGRTPFVWGALGEAKRRGATTILLCFNPLLKIRRADRPALVIAPHIGPEILTGSTRLKAGTATKLILNIFTTLAMVRLGKVLGNLMIDVKASNAKLRDRAARITQQLTGADYDAARTALERSNWEIKKACARLRRHQTR
jgi:N-acetylmuramic acid 6-phosphate etherase